MYMRLPSVTTSNRLSLRARVLVAAALAGGTLLSAHTPVSSREASSLGTSGASDRTVRARVSHTYGQVPLHFERNEGQVDSRVTFLARGSGYSLFLTPTGAVLALKDAVLRVELVGANPRPAVAGADELPGRSHYLTGNDPAKWRTNVPTYAKVRYGSVYPGVDLVYYGNQRRLEYDFIVAPGADPRRIRIAFEGARQMAIDAAGHLVLEVAGGEVRQQRPVVYQEAGGVRKEIAGRYVMTGTRQVGFEVAAYDISLPLVIDPVLVYSTFLGGSADDLASGIAVDVDGQAYVTGSTTSLDLPATAGGYDETANGAVDAFVSKLSANGSALLYSTYLGGAGADEGRAIAIDQDGNAYVTGLAQAGFPTTPLSYSPSYNNGGSDAFVAKLDATGSVLLYSTFLGGGLADEGHGIAVDLVGNVYITGQTSSSPFPTTPGAFDSTLGGASDAFVTKLNPAGSGPADLVYSTYLGGSSTESGNGIAVDTVGNAYVTGQTASIVGTGFPTTAGAFDITRDGGNDAFVTKFSPPGLGVTAVLYSTYLGGGGTESGNGIAFVAGNVYITGQTSSPPASPFPTTSGALDSMLGGTTDAFVTKLNPAGSGFTDLLYSTYLGGGSTENGNAIAVDALGNAYVTGQTASTGSTAFPTTPGAFDTTRGGASDAFVTTLNPALSGGMSLVYSTYLGGLNTESGNAIAVGLDGSTYVAGSTTSTGYPAIVGVFDTTYNGGSDAFVTKLGTPVLTLTLAPLADINPVNSTHCITATVREQLGNPVSGVAVRFAVSGAVSTSGSATTSATGRATFCYGGPASPGTDAITAFADANGDGVQNAAEPSAGAAKTWESATTVTTVTSSVNPSVYGQAVVFTATVTAGSGVPAGEVTFMDGATELETAALDGFGRAVFETSELAVGSHNITATYHGNYDTSSGALIPPQIVLPADTTAMLSSSVNPSLYGQVVMFTATVAAVAPGGGTVVGTVTISDGGTTLATVRLDAEGQASFATSSLAVGSHTITAHYNGDGNFNESDAAPVTQVVVSGATSTSIGSTPNPSFFGQNVTLTALVSPLAPSARTLAFSPPVGYGAGTGPFAVASADFNRDGRMDLAVANKAGNNLGILLGDGTGGFGSPTFVPIGTGIGPVYVVAADLNGDLTLDLVTANEGSSDVSVLGGHGDGTFDAAVNFAAESSPNGIAISDFTNDLIPDIAVANAGSNTVTILRGLGGLGFVSLGNHGPGSRPLQVIADDFNTDGNSDYAIVNVDANGVTIKFGNGAGEFPTFTSVPMDPIGRGSLALVVADFNFDGKLDLATANRTTANVTVRLGDGTGAFGPVAGFPLGDSPDDAPVLPEFMTGGDFNGDGYLDLAVTDSNHGVVSILTGTGTGTFDGPLRFNDGVAPFPFAANAAGRRTVAADLNGDGLLDLALPTLGTDVNVLLNAGVGPTGTVLFTDDGVPIGSAPIVDGRATLSISTLAVGTHPFLTAHYSSDSANYAPSTGITTHVVDKGDSTTTLTSSANPSVFGETVTFTATVAGPPGLPTPTGTVQFSDGATPLGPPVVLVDGVARLEVSDLAVGIHTIGADYSGDESYNPSQDEVDQTVHTVNSSTTVTSSANPSVFGQAVTFTATVRAVAPGSGTPTGTVQFFDNGASIGAPVELTAGSASVTTSMLSAGDHTITAEYAGDGNFNASTGSIVQTVNRAGTATSVTSNVNPSVFGQPVTFTAAVTAVAPGSGTPDGQVTFMEGAAALSGPIALDAMGQATFTLSALSAGAHTITARYSGSSSFEAGTGSIVQTVNKAGTTTSVTSSANPSFFSQSVTFTATETAVAPGAGTPDGTVQFRDNGTPLGSAVPLSGGVATLETSALGGGAHIITAEYSGSADFNSSTGTHSQTVLRAGSTTAVTSSLNPSRFEQPVTFTAIVTAIAPASGTPTGFVQFLDNGTPMGGPVALVAGSARITTSTLAPGNHTITAAYAGSVNFNVSSGTLSQTVTGDPVLKLTKSVDKATVNPGGALVYTLTYSNTGSAATGVTISDVVPEHTTFVSASHGGTNVAGTVRWTIGNVAAGASGSVTLTVRLSQAPACRAGDGEDHGKSGHTHGDGDRDDEDHRSGRNGHHRGDGCSHDDDNDDDDEGCTVSVKNQGAIRSVETPSPSRSNTVTTRVTAPSEDTKGRMTGGGTFGRERVHHGFTLNCDPQRGSNNLQVTWGSGNKFHLEGLASAACFDDPRIGPRRPSASFDTYRGTGVGRYNGARATAEWTFTDAGEPGTRDTATIVIRNAVGRIVLSASGSISNGNHQAH
jgi:uncharacterized repeat protein (TIGR01451 family)